MAMHMDVALGQVLEFEIAGVRVRITPERKSGQRARLRVEAPASVKISHLLNLDNPVKPCK